MAAKKQTPVQQPPLFTKVETIVVPDPEPTIARTFSSLIAGGVVTGSLGYGGMGLVGAATLGVAVLTGSAFLTYMIWYLGALITIVGAIMAGSYVQARLLDGSLDVACGKARSYVAGLFTFRKEVAA